MKTLVIHPKDNTTDFLSEIYSGNDWDVINANISHKILKQKIKDSDRIIMLGHGTEYGLIGFGRVVIDSKLVYLLREKYCIYIWCNADVFVKKYDLKGFYTGMIISEYEEALMFLSSFKYDDIEKSNILFADSVKKSILKDDVLSGMIDNYSSDTNEIILFNKSNLYQTNG